MGQLHAISLDGRLVTYEVRISNRARHLQMKIDPEIGLEVVVPHRLTTCDHAAFVTENTRWVLDHLDRLAQSRREFPTNDLRDGGAVVLLGRPCPLRVTRGPGRPSARYESGGILASARNVETLETALTRMLREIAKEIIASRATSWAREVGVSFKRLRLSRARSSWGTCSHDGTLSLSWRLVMAPPEILDYVVIHEVVHLLHFSHGRPFWREVGRHAPDYRRSEAWLDRYGHLLALENGADAG